MKKKNIKPDKKIIADLEQKWSDGKSKETREMDKYSDIVRALENKSVKFWCKKFVYSPQQLVRSLYQMDKLGEQMIKNIRNN